MADNNNNNNETWTRIRKFIAGYVSGACLVLAGHPFDTIKVRMQSEGSASKRFNGVVDCVLKTVKHAQFTPRSVSTRACRVASCLRGARTPDWMRSGHGAA